MKFKDQYKNQTELGKIYGLSAREIGKKLAEFGLKEGAVPTKKALDEKIAISAPLKDKTPFYMWDVKKIKGIFKEKEIKENKFYRYCKHFLKEYRKIEEEDDGSKIARISYEFLCEDVEDKVGKELAKRIINEFENFDKSLSKNAVNFTNDIDGWLNGDINKVVLKNIYSIDQIKKINDQCSGHFYFIQDDSKNITFFFDSLEDSVLFKLNS